MVLPLLATFGGMALSARDQQANTDAVNRATQISTDYGMAGIDEQRRQFGLMNQLLQPYYQAGASQLPALQQNAQSRNLMQYQQQPAFQQLLQENMQNTRDQVYGAGQSRSGWGLNQMGSSRADTLSALENTATNRLQSLAGQSQTAGSSLGNLGQSNAGSMAQLFQGIGNTQSQGALANQSINAQFANNIAGQAAGIADYYRR